MLSEEEILSTLDNSTKISPYCWFIPLAHPYSYLIDCRLNIFKGENDHWAIAAEKLGYSERGGGVELEIYYYGNCLINLGECNNHLTNYHTIYPVEPDGFNDNLEENYLKPEGGYWIVRGSKVELSSKKKDYLDKGIELKEYEPGQIGNEEAARLAVIDSRYLFRATDTELYKSIPNGLKKILVLDEWYHKDFKQVDLPKFSADGINDLYNFNKELTGLAGIDFETFSTLISDKEKNGEEQNKKEWSENRPGSYETWQQLAKVVVTGDTSFYKPTIPPNTHWRNWPESGSL